MSRKIGGTESKYLGVLKIKLVEEKAITLRV
jgi:hypothetical protein